ncbi:glutamate--tRNA ligase [Candidatus Babeliales bacterium]|nr:glutamate--tRNA ligase [Candidatus Babeliales bacterium]MBP9844174.1 glutamate--tRNA ligase [Candidatus Babeliales bacterium]
MNTCRVRFAPSPTGIMHIGNVRTALLNYIFALKNKGTFILRVEDTDQERNIDPQSIFDHLAWLGINYQEGPGVGGPCSPYFQSQRHDIYKDYLEKLQKTNHVYRCFCTQEQLEVKRNRQIALKNPPRYDRSCLRLSPTEIQNNLENQVPFIWRMKIDETQTIQFIDLGHGILTFELKNFSDFAISRVDGSFTFMFANCIDDITMKISHILRGQDHMTNTVGQITIMKALNHTFPIFWHLPILFNTDNKKLSKRDQGFSLEDLKTEGFLPQAIANYLGIIGASFEKEILSLQELADSYNFENMHTTNQIKYDIEKMKWVNHKWIMQTPIAELVQLCKPFLAQHFNLDSTSDATLTTLIQSVQTDIVVLQDVRKLLEFYFIKPVISQEQIDAIIPDQSISKKIQTILDAHKNNSDSETFFAIIKKEMVTNSIVLKDYFSYIRLLITGNPKGLGIAELEKCLGFEEIQQRLCR